MSVSFQNSATKVRVFAVLISLMILLVNPARGFELFGIHLWGEREEELTDQILNPVIYETTFSFSDGKDYIEDEIRDSSLLVQQQDIFPSGTAGLVGRAQIDQKRLIAKLYQLGRYGGLVNILINNQPMNSVNFDEELIHDEENPVKVEVVIHVGPTFKFRTVQILSENELFQDLNPEKYQLIKGDVATSDLILSAQDSILADLQNQGYPFAQITNREVIADHQHRTADITYWIDSGKQALFGIDTVEGNVRVDTEFTRKMTKIPHDKAYNPGVISDAEQRLRGLGVFNRVRIELADELDANDKLDLTISVTERKRRFVGANALISSIDGLTAATYTGHRNLFGKAENLRLELSTAGIGQRSIDKLDYGIGARLLKPAIYDVNSDLLFSINHNIENSENLFSAATRSEIGLVHYFSKYLTGTINVAYQHSEVKDDLGRKHFQHLSFPSDLKWDGRNDKLDPSTGVTGHFAIEPSFELDDQNSYVILQIGGTNYYSFGEREQLTLAAKFDVGMIPGAEIDEVPANQRFLLGGGNSIRGFDYQTIGVENEIGTVSAGLSKLEFSLEARYHVIESLGIVPFLDIGAAYGSTYPDFSEPFKFSTGIGVRYHTAIGPLRADIAIPVNRDDEQSRFGIYVGLGQVF